MTMDFYLKNHICKSFFATFFLSVFITVTLFALPCLAADNTSQTRKEEKQRIEQGIQRYRINIRRLQQGVRKQKELIKKTTEQERDLLAELENIDTRLQEQKEKLVALEERMSAQQLLIHLKEKELVRVQGEKESVQNHLQRRISAYYKMGRIGLINVAFSAETLPNLLKFHDSFSFLIEYDQSVIQTYKHTINELASAKELLTLEKNLLQEFIIQAKEEEQRIDTTKNEKLTLLSQIRNQTKLHKQAIMEMQKASMQLSASLQVMHLKKEEFQKGFLLDKGNHVPPVKGKVIALFGKIVVNKLGISSINKGIDIAAPNNTRVRAIYDGVVTYAGYLRGFGNTVIINHGFDYFSIVSRLGRITRKRGQKVDTGTLVGVMGDTAMIMDEGLHFEIRHGSEQLDPLQWLDETDLIIE